MAWLPSVRVLVRFNQLLGRLIQALGNHTPRADHERRSPGFSP